MDCGLKEVSAMSKAEAIAVLNEEYRRSFVDGTVLLTSGVIALDSDGHRRLDLMLEVRAFKNFTKGDDPHGEHDFGAITINGRMLNFETGYYTHYLKDGSEDPATAKKTRRVMTNIFASEY